MRVSTGKGGERTRAQRFQNKVAFCPNKYSPVAMKIAATHIKGVCQRCKDIIDWKKRLNKYKPLSQPKTCIGCSKRTVVEAYHVMCTPCAVAKNVCAKCHTASDIVHNPIEKTQSQIAKDKEELEKLMGRLSERHRRSYLRKIEQEDVEGAQKVLDAALKLNADGEEEAGSDDEDDELVF